MGNEDNISLAFTAGKGPRKKVTNIQLNVEDDREHITSFKGEERGPVEPMKEKLRIDPLPNTFRDGKRYVPSFVPEKVDHDDLKVTGIDKFEQVDVDDMSQVTAHIKYGLTKREKNVPGKEALTQDDRDTEALREDLEHLPPESSLGDYQRMPIEAFGEALMRGMGWSEGRGIGRNAKKDVEAKELVRRADRLGLGADPAAPTKKQKRFIKPGESREVADMVYVDDSGAVKSSRPVNATLTNKRTLGVVVGKRMYVQSGRHSGFECEVKSIEQSSSSSSDRATVRLLPSLEMVSVRCKDLVEMNHKRQKTGNELTNGTNKKLKVDSKHPSHHYETKPWLYPNIRVKIIDKKAFDGKLYLKKGTVLDVKSPTVCDVFVDDFNEVFQDLHQSQMETSVPRKEGSTVKIVAGRFKGRVGQLLHRSKHSEYVALQINDEDEVKKLHLDDIAEYRGPIDE